METTIIANALLFVALALLFINSWLGVAFLGALVYASKRSRKLGRLWVRYYRIVSRWENLLLKGGTR